MILDCGVIVVARCLIGPVVNVSAPRAGHPRFEAWCVVHVLPRRSQSSRRRGDVATRRWGDGDVWSRGDQACALRTNRPNSPRFLLLGALARNNGQRRAAEAKPDFGRAGRRLSRQARRTDFVCDARCPGATFAFLSHVYQVVSFRCQASAWHTTPPSQWKHTPPMKATSLQVANFAS